MDFMAEEGFNFVRLPMDYRLWTENYEYFKPNEYVLNTVLDKYIEEANARHL
ncbi:MAG: glycoside hydrolase, partial [candidate division Zixibacteria bacterium]|nr:glycoside hydrolase [Phycisphaerae bacterium]NIW39022.1 glycoside hydrolase [candidate division Zixibacteria bacterium]NIX54367.1 glycoside hydrolase [candidate division Zixibacteria bacterium]